MRGQLWRSCSVLLGLGGAEVSVDQGENQGRNINTVPQHILNQSIQTMNILIVTRLESSKDTRVIVTVFPMIRSVMEAVTLRDVKELMDIVCLR